MFEYPFGSQVSDFRFEVKLPKLHYSADGVNLKLQA